jgi:hypothetical protein
MDTTSPFETLASRTYSTLPYSFPYTHSYRSTPTPTPDTDAPVPLPDVSSLENSTFHGSYHTLEEIELFVVALASTYPKLVEVVWLGESWENRDVFAIRIGKRGGRRKKGKKGKKGKGKEMHADVGRGGGRGGGRGRGRVPRTGAGGHATGDVFSLFRFLFRGVRATYRWLASFWGSRDSQTRSSIRDFYVGIESDLDTQRHVLKDRIVIQGAQHAREVRLNFESTSSLELMIHPSGSLHQPPYTSHTLSSRLKTKMARSITS